MTRAAAKRKHVAGKVRAVFGLTRLHAGEANRLLRECEGAEGFEFVEKVLDCFDASYSLHGRELERIPAEGAVVFCLEHPLSLLQAAALLAAVGRVRRDVRTVANDLLLPFAGLRPLLLPAQALRAALEREEAVIVAPTTDLAGITAPRLSVSVGGRNWARFAGLTAIFQRGATLPIRIRARGTLLGFAGEMPVAHPEDRLALRRELRAARLLGETGDGKQIYLFDAMTDSAVLRELGRLREIAFRRVGEGTGKRRDIDRYDAYYRHVVLWDDAELQVAGAYRIGEAANIVAERGEEGLYTQRLFEYGDGLRRHFGEALELGRSFVQPRYQGMRALDYLWQGIGAYLAERPEIRYLFGAVSLSASYPLAARRMLVYFFERFYGTREPLAAGRVPPAMPQSEAARLERIFSDKSDIRTLKRALAALGVSIPVLYKQYAELCEPGGTRFLAFSVDPAFASCVDGLVLVDIHHLKAAKRERYLRASGAPEPGVDLGRRPGGRVEGEVVAGVRMQA